MRKVLAALAVGAALLTFSPAARADDEDAAFDSSRWLDRNRIRLDWQQVAPVVKKGKLTFGSQIRMHPPGFRADTYDLFSPTYGFANGWEVTAGVTMAQRLGPGGNAFFYGAGIQKEILRGEGWIPSISLGGYGMAGPHDYFGGSLYLVATERLYSDPNGLGIYFHGGARWEIFSSDDYGDANGIRPFLGATIDYKKRYSLSGDFSPRQGFEGQSMWSVRGAVRVYKNVSISGGIRSSGYRTEPFVGIWF